MIGGMGGKRYTWRPRTKCLACQPSQPVCGALLSFLVGPRHRIRLSAGSSRPPTIPRRQPNWGPPPDNGRTLPIRISRTSQFYLASLGQALLYRHGDLLLVSRFRARAPGVVLAEQSGGRGMCFSAPPAIAVPPNARRLPSPQPRSTPPRRWAL